ncbi:MAG: hypothetical protein ACLSCU_07170 [Eubacterium sp.]
MGDRATPSRVKDKALDLEGIDSETYTEIKVILNTKENQVWSTYLRPSYLS